MTTLLLDGGPPRFINCKRRTKLKFLDPWHGELDHCLIVQLKFEQINDAILAAPRS